MTALSPLITTARPKSPRESTSDPQSGKSVAIASPWLPPLAEVVAQFEEIWSRGQVTNATLVERLEHEAAIYLGVRECVAVSSCTAGLILVARCLELSGEVILPSFTFFASGHALLWNGLTPVFADCDRDTFNIDTASVERLCTQRTSAILAIHLFGCPAAVGPLQKLAHSRGIPLLFDGAHAFGARAGGKGVAEWGDATVFSLAATKPLVAGEGGLIATADAQLARRLRQARNYGNDGSYDCPILGLNARMTELQAALALAGLPYVAQGIDRRKYLASMYQQRLLQNPGLRVQQPPAGSESTWNGFPLWVGPESGIGRRGVEQALAADGVETRRYYDPPLHRQKLYKKFHQPARDPLTLTESVSSRVVSLPLHASLEPEAVERIARRLLDLGAPGQSARSMPTAV